MKETKARILCKKYPELFMAMYLHSLDEGHPDDNGVILAKLTSNAMGKAEPYWTPEDIDMKPIYEDILGEPCEACKIEV